MVVYGASGYTGKLIAESLHERGTPFIAAGRNPEKIAAALEIVAQRAGAKRIDARIVGVTHDEAALADLFRAAYGEAFAAKQRLLAPACSYMWTVGGLAAEVVLVCGYEKLFHEDKRRTFDVFNGAVDVEDPAGLHGLLQAVCDDLGIAPPDAEGAERRSAFMDIHAVSARYHMQKWGTTAAQFAAVSAKNSQHGSLNPNAQYRDVLSVADVPAARAIVDPLTLPGTDRFAQRIRTAQLPAGRGSAHADPSQSNHRHADFQQPGERGSV